MTWTNPPEYLSVGQKISINYEAKTLDTLLWTMGNNHIYLDQGWGVYFYAPDGTKIFYEDIKAVFTSEKPVETGSKGITRVLQIAHGMGFYTEYYYEWIE